MTATTEATARFLDFAVAGDRRAGADFALSLLDDGHGFGEVVATIGHAQREVGDRWHRNEWTVADEHVATGVAAAALETAAAAAPRVEADGHVVVTCAEGDWHALPARMFAEELSALGWRVTFLGASTPVDHLVAFLRTHPATAVAVTCSLPIFFPGVARIAEEAHAAGVPILVGGRALGDRQPGAALLGADGGAADAAEAAALFSRWREECPPLTAPHLDPAALELDSRATDAASEAMGLLARRWPSMAAYDARQLRRTEEDLAYIVRFVAAAQLLDDPSVFSEFLAWQGALLAARGVPAGALQGGLQVLGEIIGKCGGLLAAGA